MGLKKYFEEKKIIRCTLDKKKATALIQQSERTLNEIKYLPPGPLILTNAYSALRQILEAITLTKGLKFYSHEAYTYYLKELGEEQAAATFDRYRILRNRIEYDGKNISRETAEEALNEMEQLISLLKERYLK